MAALLTATAVAANSTSVAPTTSAVASSFQVAVTFAVAYVRGKRVTTLNALAPEPFQYLSGEHLLHRHRFRLRLRDVELAQVKHHVGAAAYHGQHV
jgi:hypothetical protein